MAIRSLAGDPERRAGWAGTRAGWRKRCLIATSSRKTISNYWKCSRGAEVARRVRRGMAASAGVDRKKGSGKRLVCLE
jgi:hypothetical protein